MARDDPHFNFRMPLEVREKIKNRAAANGRSMNAELLQIVQDALEQPSPVSGYRDDAERLADQQAEQFKKVVFDTLKGIYSKEK
ncbi:MULTISPECIES: Arc family DNA-binding protein [Klebsiella]|uniref:Arc family DNA-binding protein n=1 Tax=Klebsiella TaxID=570 RepID=UPI000B41DE93|nr:MULTISPECIES: Arc family DNA-binding protein [Klebsiella]ELT8146629.1 Arc family DNA-binding protein [Klebsiella oxytoca]HDU3763962.1 Arc family DNA-binding protein [Klebsiella aerogenes]MBA1590104.1 Arc family DNA-binding protein [Klebsiella pneumoniae]MBS3674179.1 Arc family DNA-binding protein [Klebsiella quasipneumoniae]MBV0620704.1 Arc family DNA-binding protein [Klebsiella pneumoniae]